MIYIIRHGQTEKNRARVLQGRSDVPLNQEGRNQAARVRDWFQFQDINFDMVYSSPLQRAVETAAIITKVCPLRIDHRLIEMDYGPYEGMDLLKPLPEVSLFFSDFVHNPAPAGMESLEEVVRRAGAFMEEIKPDAGGKSILVSTHAIAMKGILEYLTPDSHGSWWSKYVSNCSVYRTEVVGNHYSTPEEVFCL